MTKKSFETIFMTKKKDSVWDKAEDELKEYKDNAKGLVESLHTLKSLSTLIR